MSVTSWHICGTCISWDHDSDSDMNPWTNPSNLTADDGSNAESYNYSLPSFGTPEVLKATNFGFTTADIPSGSTINGIEVRIGDAYASAGTIVDDLLQLVDETGALVGTDKSTGSVISLSASPTNYDIGGASDKWGWTGVTDAKMRDSDTGVAVNFVGTGGFNYRAYSDFIAMRVYYTAPATVKRRNKIIIL